MINTRGIIQNNKAASDFIRKQRRLNKVYGVMDKAEERAFIEKYTRLKYDENGKLIYRTEPSAPGKNDDYQCDFEWIGDETELRLALVMHNLQAVTKTATKHCQDTRDFDNMYAKGLFGLVRAANEFHPYKLITQVVGHKIVDGKKVPIREIKLDKDGNIGFIKFVTYAQNWIFKYVMDEFYTKSIKIDNNSVSLNELVNMHSGDNRNMTMENYLHKSLAPELEPQGTVVDEISANEVSELYESMQEYIDTSSDLSAIERNILKENFVNGTENLKKLSSILQLPQKDILENQVSALNKLKEYLYDEFGIEQLSDVL